MKAVLAVIGKNPTSPNFLDLIENQASDFLFRAFFMISSNDLMISS